MKTRANGTTGLLPTGLGDVLPPMAEQRVACGDRLLALLAAHGYDLVEPPLLDFAENLAGVELDARAFRLSDPVSGKMLVIRADITPQIGRIAQSRLQAAPRPLRLSYGGTVIRVKGSQVSPERQFTQIGAELIGESSPEADVEMIRLAVLGLTKLGISKITCDFTLPRLVPELLAHFADALDEGVRQALLAALRHKDSGQIRDVLIDAHPIPPIDAKTAAARQELADIFAVFFTATGPIIEGIARLARLKPHYAEILSPYLQVLQRLTPEVTRLLPDLSLTLDPLESRGFDYHSELQFNLFAEGVQGEIASGGRYFVGRHSDLPGDSAGEPAIGITWYLEKIWPLLPKSAAKNRVYLPPFTDWDIQESLQNQGYVTINGLPSLAKPEHTLSPQQLKQEAQRLLCQFIYQDGKLHPIN